MKSLLPVLLLLTACGGSSPIAPTQPPRVTLQTTDRPLNLPDWPCDGQCRYTFTFQSLGPDCARNVRGTLRILKDGEVLADDAWALDATRVISPNELVEVNDGPIPAAVIMVGGKYTVAYRFEAVKCQ